jgi:hypothetical protein
VTGQDQPVRRVAVAPERLAGWVERFVARHGPVEAEHDHDEVRLRAADGAIAVIAIPFPAMAEPADPLPALLAHVGRDRRIGAVLVRRGGYAVGVFDGPALIASKVGGSYVQGRTKAGGWSQQRYARRRANQAAQAYAEAADAAVRVLGPVADDLEAVVGGGDRPGVEAVLADPRLAGVRARFGGVVLPTPDPRLRVLEAFGDQLRAVMIDLNDLA